jgi:glutamate-ammonia-ligase adenylyltransferase
VTPEGYGRAAREDVLRRMRSAAGRREDPEAAVLADPHGSAASELFRVAVADLSGCSL